MTLTTADLDRIEQLALVQIGRPISTPIVLMAGVVLELVRRARLAPPMQPALSETEKP